jgi:hypothetical protein
MGDWLRPGPRSVHRGLSPALFKADTSLIGDLAGRSMLAFQEYRYVDQ